VAVDLVDDRQEVLRAQPLAPVDFVQTNRFDALQDAVRQPPLNEPIHRAIDRLPTGMEGAGRFPPRQAPRPTGPEDHHGDRDRAFARAPGDVLDANAVLRTLHPARRVVELGPNPPQRHERPRAFGQPVVARGRLLALRAFAVHARVRLQVDVDPQAGALLLEADLSVDEAGEMLNPVQDGLNVQLNSWSPGSGFVVFEQPQTTQTIRDQLFVSGLLHRSASGDAAVAPAEDRALRGRNPSADRSLHTADGPGGRFTLIVRPLPTAGAASKRKIPGGSGDRVPHFTHKFCYRAGFRGSLNALLLSFVPFVPVELEKRK